MLELEDLQSVQLGHPAGRWLCAETVIERLTPPYAAAAQRDASALSHQAHQQHGQQQQQQQQQAKLQSLEPTAKQLAVDEERRVLRVLSASQLDPAVLS